MTVTGPGVHRDVPVGVGGSYSVTVPAGRYTITGHSPLYGSGTYLCRATEVATVTSGHTTTCGTPQTTSPGQLRLLVPGSHHVVVFSFSQIAMLAVTTSCP